MESLYIWSFTNSNKKINRHLVYCLEVKKLGKEFLGQTRKSYHLPFINKRIDMNEEGFEYLKQNENNWIYSWFILIVF